ncbi:MAG: starch-binding protein [Lachnospiraceae bacterium]|nr:starch-binding protein [Lachnospiraceae bacterium]
MKKSSSINKIIFIVFLACIFFVIGFSTVKHNWASPSGLNEESSMTVHYYNSDDWDAPFIYYYSDNYEAESWPGMPMQPEGNNWYSYTIYDRNPVKVIFSDRGNHQNPGSGLEGYPVEGNAWYCNGNWYDHEPDSTIVHFYNENWKNVNIYYYQEGQNTVNWPGTSMHREGGNWYVYEIIGCENPNVIFNDAGNNQIPGQNEPGFPVSGEKWYYNGIWYDENPLGTGGDTSIKVHFYKPDNWNEPYIYYYASDTDTGPAWPGTKMEAAESGWYKCTITKYSVAKVLFNDGVHQIPEAEQEGFEVTGSMWYKDGIWYHVNPDLTEENPLTGDLNGDGVIDEKDLDLLERFLSGEITLNEEQKKLADINEDGVVDEKDRDTLEQYINGETTEIPEEDETEGFTDRAVSYEYDKLGRVIKAVYDSENYIEYSYDKNGNITDVRVTGNID